ncbi:MAG: aspartate--tRNA ligase [Terriglobales bacterium]
MLRTLCSQVTGALLGQKVVLAGWLGEWRIAGEHVLMWLRDWTGTVELVFDASRLTAGGVNAAQLRFESVVKVEGTVIEDFPIGADDSFTRPSDGVCVEIEKLVILSVASKLPYRPDQPCVDEKVRLRHRWIELRGHRLQRNLRLRARMVGIIRRSFEEAGFLEIQTPLLWRPGSESDREFLVASRLQPGKFFALPQSPQLAKQLLAIGGFERYYQVATCFREELAAVDRSAEFTQFDIEMTFPDKDYLFSLVETALSRVWSDCIGTQLTVPFSRLKYTDAISRYGSDVPDLRIHFEIADLTNTARTFGVLLTPDAVMKSITVTEMVSTGFRERLVKMTEASENRTNVHTLVVSHTGEIQGSFAGEFCRWLLTGCWKPGQTLIVVGGDPNGVMELLTSVRRELASESAARCSDEWSFVWIDEPPLVEWSPAEKRWYPTHHGFTRPTTEWESRFSDEPAKAEGISYDLVLNGVEVGGGSFRIHEHDLQVRLFDLLGISRKMQMERFGILLDALRTGAPPHGGMALGIDRLAMILCNETKLDNVVAFPKDRDGNDAMTGAPVAVSGKQLRRRRLKLDSKNY